MQLDSHCDTLQDEKAATEMRLQDALSSRDQLSQQVQHINRKLEAAEQATGATATQLRTVQVRFDEICKTNLALSAGQLLAPWSCYTISKCRLSVSC